MVPVLLTSTSLLFFALRLLPGDPALAILSGSRHAETTREALRAELGLDRPLTAQYGQWLASMARGELGGRSLQTREAIPALLARQGPVTLLLALYTLLLTVAVAPLLGAAAAHRHGAWPDRLIRAVAFCGVSVPVLLASLVVIVALLRVLHWTPPIIYAGPLADAATHVQVMLVPVLLLSWEHGGHLVRITRASLLDALAGDAVAAARARGLRTRRILFGHALRLSLPMVLASLRTQAAALLGGVVVVESVFGLPGIGRGLVAAALARDYPVVQAIAFFLVLAGLLLDLALAAAARLVDPRDRVDA